MLPKKNSIMFYLSMCNKPPPFTLKTYLADVPNEEFVIAVGACVANHKATTTWSNGAWKWKQNFKTEISFSWSHYSHSRSNR